METTLQPKIELAWITVSDLDKAIEFYTQCMGFEVLERSEEFGWAELKGKAGALLGLALANPFNPIKSGSNAVVTITVQNIEMARNEMESKGTKMVGDIMEVPNHVKLQMFSDADGNLLQLVEHLEIL